MKGNTRDSTRIWKNLEESIQTEETTKIAHMGKLNEIENMEENTRGSACRVGFAINNYVI